MEDLEIWQLICIVIIGAGAGFVQRVSGFGLGIFAMLFLPSFMPATSAAAISCLFSCGTSTYNTIQNRKQIPFKTILPLLCAAAVVIPVAVLCAPYVPAKIFKILLGIVLILLSLYFLFFSGKIKMKASFGNGIIAGSLGGALNGLFSTGGPPAVIYLSNATDSNAAYFAAIQCYFCLTNIYSTVIRIFNGIITLDLLICTAIGFVGCMAGNFVGKLVFDKLDAKKLKFIIYIGMIISGALMIIQAK